MSHWLAGDFGQVTPLLQYQCWQLENQDSRILTLTNRVFMRLKTCVHCASSFVLRAGHVFPISILGTSQSLASLLALPVGVFLCHP